MKKRKTAEVISKIQVKTIKPKGGLVGFASFVLYESLYCSCVAIYTRHHGGFRLVYPTKRSGDRDMDVFHPISEELGNIIEEDVLLKYYEVKSYDRHRVPLF